MNFPTIESPGFGACKRDGESSSKAVRCRCARRSGTSRQSIKRRILILVIAFKKRSNAEEASSDDADADLPDIMDLANLWEWAGV